MRRRPRSFRKLRLAGLALALGLLGFTTQAQTTTPGVAVEILGVGAEFLLGGDLTDPENDGLDELGAADDPSWNWKSISASHEPDFEGGENAFNIFDNKVGGGNDKWCCDDPTPDNPVWVAVEFDRPYRLTHFTVTSGNDTPTRDPTHWAIQGSTDGVNYTDIYLFYDTLVPWTERNQVVKFTLPVPAAPYNWFRYIAYETPADLHQINEIEYFGIVGELVDTDQDGMPDDYEIAKGFDPNDPSDAAEDCDGDGATNLEEYLAGTDPCDTTKPTIVGIASTASFNTVMITFSEELDPATATATANYTITPSLAVTAASYSRRVVTLTTGAQTPGGTAYTVAVSGVQDTSKNAVEAGTQATFYSYLMTRTGVLKFSFWGGIAGTAVQALYDEFLRYPDSPDWTGAVFSFNSRDILPTDANDNYGATIEGYLTPTESGSYRFFVYSDDASELYLSTDATPDNLWWIAAELACCNAFTEPDGVHTRTSEPIALVANQRYFIRLVYKEGGGGDYGQVAWRKEGDPTPAASLRPIPGKYLSAAMDLPAPAEGAFVTQTPAPNARNVMPDATITIAHRDGKTAWTAENVSLKLNGVAVTPTFTKDANVATITYKPSAMFPSGSTHTVSLGYLDAGGQPTTTEWSFEVTEYKGPILDKVNGYAAILLGAAQQTADQGGHTGAAGDLALDTGVVAGVGYVADASFLNAATADDTLSVAFFLKLRSVRAGSAFWANSPSSNNGTRGYQAHVPWSDSTIYFDSSGCCGADTQRINLNIDQFLGYSGDASWWQQWHHFAFVKDGAEKRIYINGQLFHSGGGDPLKTDFTSLLMGGGPSATENRMDGFLDDFVIYNGALTQAQANSLSTGAAPSSIAGLIAHWDYNDQPAATVTLKAVRSGANVTVTSEPAALPAGWVLQTAPSVNGPWTTQAGTTPATVPIGADNAFLRAAKP
ncbi:MAG: discoidin domain-containing protein [Verrucomicrobiales bacterium]|nr:discoidin domain-containing protein [Verrucomicrobiales bacterium]